MKRNRFNEEQVIGILKDLEGGMPMAEVCRRHGISSATFYKWKSKFCGLGVSEVRCLRSLEVENLLLKKLLAEAMLDNAVLKDLVSKKWYRPAPSGKPSFMPGSTRDEGASGVCIGWCELQGDP
jgi:putative transposase